MIDKRESQSIFPCCEKSMLCLREKFYILFSKERLRNNRNEVVSRCSYGNKHELSSYIKVKVIYIYGIHHWRILWSSYRKLAWVGFEPTTTEFRSDALTDWSNKVITMEKKNTFSKNIFDTSLSWFITFYWY